MGSIGERIRSWCEQESFPVEGREEGPDLVVTLPSEGSPEVSVRDLGDRVVLTHSVELSIPADIPDEVRGQIPALVERAATTRGGLVDYGVPDDVRGAAEIAVTLHEDGLSKHGFMAALAEIEKGRRIIAWELEGMSAAAGVLSDVRAMVEQAAAVGEQELACPSCGKPAKPEHRFCTGCSAELPRQAG